MLRDASVHKAQNSYERRRQSDHQRCVPEASRRLPRGEECGPGCACQSAGGAHRGPAKDSLIHTTCQVICTGCDIHFISFSPQTDEEDPQF